MRKLRELTFTFACVTTGTVFGSAIYISIFWKDAPIDGAILWEILICSFICTLGNFLYMKEEKSKKQYYGILFIHYIYINAVVLGCGVLFKWFLVDDITMILSMMIMIAVIFIIVASFLQVRSKKETGIMNEKLKEYIDHKAQ